MTQQRDAAQEPQNGRVLEDPDFFQPIATEEGIVTGPEPGATGPGTTETETPTEDPAIAAAVERAMAEREGQFRQREVEIAQRERASQDRDGRAQATEEGTRLQQALDAQYRTDYETAVNQHGMSETQALAHARAMYGVNTARVEERLQARQREQYQHARIQSAGEIAERNGIPLTKLLRFSSQQDMQAFAEDWGEQNAKMRDLETRLASVETNRANERAPAGQRFEEAGGRGGAPSSLSQRALDYAMGKTDVPPPEIAGVVERGQGI